MKSQKLSVSYPKEYESNNGTRTVWIKLGVAFAQEDGRVRVMLDAMPPPKDGQFQFNLFPENDEKKTLTNDATGVKLHNTTNGVSGPESKSLESDIPF